MYNIGFIVNHPTQFEVPFYQYVSKHDANNQLDVFYLENNKVNDHFDKELGRSIKWGIDLYGGYSYHFLGENRLAGLEQLLEKKKYDLIIINGYKDHYKELGNICRKKGIPVALRMDTVLFNQSALNILLRKLLLKKEYRVFDHFLVTGTVTKDYLHAMGIKDNKINIFSYCVDNDFFGAAVAGKTTEVADLKKQLKLENEKVIVTVAKFMQRESPWDVLRAFTALNRKDLALVIVGDGEEREALHAFAAQFPDLKIRFTGYVQYTELPLYYNISTVFIHAAKDEPWGVSVQEAIAGGCRVICSDKVGAAVDMVKEGENGATYTFGNHQQLAGKIQQVLAVDENIVKLRNEQVLAWWNYATMWSEIIKATETVKQ